MMKFKTIIVILLFGGTLAAQTPAGADSLYNAGNYTQAYEMYQTLSKRKPKETLYNYRMALCGYQLNDTAKAIGNFKKSAKKHPESYYYLGDIYFNAYRFDKAIQAFENYLKTSTAENQPADAPKKLQQAELGERFLRRIEDVEIVDSLVVDKNDFLRKFHLPADVGNLTQEIVYADDKPVDKICYATQRGDRKYVSDMTDGQSDLFTAYKLLDDWAERTPLTDINTAAYENYPFLMLDGVTLYFARDGESSLGGYDIFITRLNPHNNTFLKPENVGMPYNSPFNDYMMMVDETHKTGWFLSDRYQPEGKAVIYRFVPNFEKKIIRTENQDSLIERAKIGYFERKKERSNFTSNEKLSASTKKSSSSQFIFINDRVSYTSPDEFKSNTARNYYFQWQKLSAEQKNIRATLEGLRKSYSETSNADVRGELSGKILHIEQQLLDMQPQVKELEKMVRNTEIEYLLQQ